MEHKVKDGKLYYKHEGKVVTNWYLCSYAQHVTYYEGELDKLRARIAELEEAQLNAMQKEAAAYWVEKLNHAEQRLKEIAHYPVNTPLGWAAARQIAINYLESECVEKPEPQP